MKEVYHYHYCRFCQILVSYEKISGVSNIHSYDEVCDQCKTGRVNREERKSQNTTD